MHFDRVSAHLRMFCKICEEGGRVLEFDLEAASVPTIDRDSRCRKVAEDSA